MIKIPLIFVFVTMGLFIAAGCAPNSVIQENTPVPNPPAGTPAPNGQLNVPGVSIQLYAPGLNPMINTADIHGQPAGFWLGLWHGIISPVTLLLSFVNNKDVQMYEVHNNGNLYNLGFFLGVLVMPGVFGLLLGSRRS
jgi:hypothetical protein